MIELGIDEMTIVLQATADALDAMSLDDWPTTADQMVQTFLGLTGLVDIYGEVVPEPRCPSGYTEALTLGEHGFYLAIAVNERQPRMGVCIRFSAQATAYFVENVGEPYLLLQSAHSPDDYDMHLSRIDLTADYVDEGLNVTDIYRGLTSGSIMVMREQVDSRTGELKERKAASKLSGYAVSDKVPTFYLGFRKANVDALLRVYDKKIEQIEKKGVRLALANSCNDWVRFEASLRHGYARQFGDALLCTGNDAELAVLVASVFLQRYRFYAASSKGAGLAPWTQSLANAIGTRSIRLSSDTSRNNDLAASLDYIVKGSGLLPLPYKSASIWGDGAPNALLAWTLGKLNDFEPNHDHRSWIKKNSADYARAFPRVDDFLASRP